MKIHIFLLSIIILLASCKPSASDQKSNETSAPGPDGTPVTSISLKEVWSTSSDMLVTPESVIFDKELGVYYVSCIGGMPPTAEDGDGFIAKLDQRGNILTEKWVTDIDAPKGMAISGDVLYVTDINELVKIDRKTGEILEKIEVSDAVFLNDAATAPDGTIYFTDMGTASIHTYKDSLALYLHSDDIEEINGIHVDHETIYASSGGGAVNTIDIATKKVTQRADGIKSGDGIEPWKGGFIVSSWSGEIWYVSSQWVATKVMDTKGQKINTADFTINYKTGQLLVPTFFDNRVIAYDIK